MDYGTIIINTDNQSNWECRCGSKVCRGRIRGDDWKKLVNVYSIDHFPIYLRAKIPGVISVSK